MTAKTKGMEFAFAKPAHEAAVKSLLAECGLPFEDISEHVIHFITAKSKGVLVGVVGLEALGSVGYRRLERTDAPEAIQNTKEFSMFCPQTATCMAKEIRKLPALGGQR
ncbi:MAG: hypothetical protein HYY45_02515 [Deltaproteobacteria bacterium]|nr:hypothetical protein [Deltaproteobacteria bacterium]